MSKGAPTLSKLESREQRGETHVLELLVELCEGRGLDGLSGHLADLASLVGDDLARLQREIQSLHAEQRVAERAAMYLLEASGKRLRPLCVALAARVGDGFNASALDIAVAVELVHNATLLHDDVIDLASTRRGLPAAREEFGNAASIFAGDWLLIEALQRVHRADVEGVLESLLDTIREMIRGESLQLENRGCLEVDRQLYFQIAESKSATLFQWALRAGGKAGGLRDQQCEALSAYGRHLGIAFQLVDDLLDLTGDTERTGKGLFADLREGKMTYPLIVALEREPGLRTVLSEIVQGAGSSPSHEVPQTLRARVREALGRTRALVETRELAQDHIDQAVSSIEALPQNPATAAMVAVAQSTIFRSS